MIKNKVAGVITHIQSSYRKNPLRFILSSLVAGIVFALPFERLPSLPVSIYGTNIDLRLSFVFGGLLIISVIWNLFQDKKARAEIFKSEYLILAFFLFVYLLVALISSDLNRSLAVWIFTYFTILVGVSVSLAWKYCNPIVIGKVLRLCTWIVIIFGFYQYVGDAAGLSMQWTGLRDIYVKGILGFTRIQSTGLEPLFYANFLLIPFFYFCTKYVRRENKYSYLIAALTIQLILSVSRGAIIGAIVGVLFLVVITLKNKQGRQLYELLGIIIIGIVLALCLTMLPGLLAKKSSSNVPSTEPTAVAVVHQASNLTSQDDRIRNRELAWEAFKESPLIGIGPGNFSHFAKDRFTPYQDTPGYLIVNNEPLELLAEAGIIGALSIFIFAILLIVKAVKRLWKGTDLSQPNVTWGIALVSYLIALAVQYQTFSTLYIMHIWVAIGILLGITLSSKNTSKNKKSKT